MDARRARGWVVYLGLPPPPPGEKCQLRNGLITPSATHTRTHAHRRTGCALQGSTSNTDTNGGSEGPGKRRVGEGHHLPFPFAPQVLKGKFVISRHVCACERASSCVCVCVHVCVCVILCFGACAFKATFHFIQAQFLCT